MMNPAWKSTIGLALVAVSVSLLFSACGTDNPAELVASARSYQAKGDHQAAIIQLKNALQQQPEHGEARVLLGQSALTVGDAVSAEKEFRKALEIGQPKATVVPLLAAAMIESGESEKLVREFAETKLEDAKAEAELRARVGEAQLRLRKPTDAAASFAAALVADAGNVRARFGQIRLTAIDGKLDEAIAGAEQFVGTHPESPDALRLLAELKLARGDRAGARAALERAIAAAPATPNPRFELIALLLFDGQFDAAAEQVAAARAARIADLRLTYFDAVIAFGRKDLAKAREHAQQVLKRVPEHVPTLVVLAAVEVQDRQFVLAEGHLQKVLSLVPQHAGARALLAKGYLGSAQPARALEALRPLMETVVQTDPALMMLAGEAYLANGDLKQAAALFESASKVKAQQPLARTRIGQIALLSGDVEGGIRELEGVAAAAGAPIQAELALLAAYVRQGQSGKALDVARGLVKSRPDDPMVHHTLGSVLLARKETAAARAAFAKALELNATYMPAAASLAQLDLGEGKLADARGRFESVLAKQPKNELALLGLAEVLARGKAPSAEIATVLKSAVAADPRSVTARVALINLYLHDRDARAALAVAQEMPASLGSDPRALDALGRAQVAAGDTNQAIETFNRAAAAEPKSVTPLLRLASVYAGRKEHEKAAEALLRAQKIAPGNPVVERDVVLAYLEMGKRDEALKQARALQAASPRSPAGFGLEGDIHAATKQWAAAEKAYREGLATDPKSVALAVKLHAVLLASSRKPDADSLARQWLADRPNDAMFRSYLGEQALRARDLKVAAAQYEAVVALQPDNGVALNNLAWTLGQLGDPKALGYAERALKVAPDSPSVLDTIGVLLTSRGEAAKASGYLARAVTLAPERHEIRLNYARALMKAGRAEEARNELARLQAVSDFSGKAEVAELLKQ